MGCQENGFIENPAAAAESPSYYASELLPSYAHYSAIAYAIEEAIDPKLERVERGSSRSVANAMSICIRSSYDRIASLSSALQVGAMRSNDM